MSHITTADNTVLYVRDWGKGQPVVLIHGWPLSADSWDYIAMKLVQAGYRVISYDRRGFGRSGQPWSGYEYDTFADDLKAVITSRNLDAVSLVGFSMGGGEIARYLSRHQGAGVARVALLSSVVPFLLRTDDHQEGVPKKVFDDMLNGLLRDRAHFYTGFFKDFYGYGMLEHPVSQEFLNWNTQVAMQASLKATLDCVTAFSHTDFRPDLASFKVPTLIIHGSADNTVPIDVTAFAVKQAVPHATLIEYEGEPHGILATAADRVVNDLLSFLSTS